MNSAYIISLLLLSIYLSGCSSTVEVIPTEIDPWSVSLSLHNVDQDLKEVRLTNTSDLELELLIVTRTFPGALIVAREGERPRYFLTSKYYRMMVHVNPWPKIVRLAPSDYIAYDLRVSDLVPAFHSDPEIADNDLVRVDLMHPGAPFIGITSKWILAAELLGSESGESLNPKDEPVKP